MKWSIVIKLARSYSGHYKKNIIHDIRFELVPEWIAFPFYFWSSIEMYSTHTWFDDYIYERISNYPAKVLAKLDIWDEEFVQYYDVHDPRKCLDKWLHTYLHITNKYKNNIAIRLIDKLLRYIY